MLRTVGLHHSRQRLSPLIRLYSIPTPSTGPSGEKPPLPLPSATKKPKIDLRPAPIKPKPASSSPKLPRSFTSPQYNSPSSAHKLLSAKEEVKHDLHDAEAHGILTPPPADANWFKRTLHQAIQLFKFYFRGVKLVFIRRKQISIIKQRIKTGGEALTRAEFRLIETQKDDINKIIPFLLIALVLEEVIPLIAIYAPFMLPSTCILPSQRERIESKRAEKAKAFSLQYSHLLGQLKEAERPAGFLPFSILRFRLIPEAPTAVCGLLGLSTIGFNALRIRRIRRHLEFITRDDQLLLQETRDLSKRELTEALEERGIIAMNLSHQDLQSRLNWWLDAVKDSSSEVDDTALSRRLALVISTS